MAALTGRQLGCLLAEALGIEIKGARKLTIECDAAEMACVTVERLICGEQASKAATVLEAYVVLPTMRSEPAPVLLSQGEDDAKA